MCLTAIFMSCPSNHGLKCRLGHATHSRDPRHGITLMSVSCRHDPKYFVLCHALGRDRKPCYNPPQIWHGLSRTSRQYQIVHMLGVIKLLSLSFSLSMYFSGFARCTYVGRLNMHSQMVLTNYNTQVANSLMSAHKLEKKQDAGAYLTVRLNQL